MFFCTIKGRLKTKNRNEEIQYMRDHIINIIKIASLFKHFRHSERRKEWLLCGLKNDSMGRENEEIHVKLSSLLFKSQITIKNKSFVE